MPACSEKRTEKRNSNDKSSCAMITVPSSTVPSFTTFTVQSLDLTPEVQALTEEQTLRVRSRPGEFNDQLWFPVNIVKLSASGDIRDGDPFRPLAKGVHTKRAYTRLILPTLQRGRTDATEF